MQPSETTPQYSSPEMGTPQLERPAATPVQPNPTPPPLTSHNVPTPIAQPPVVATSTPAPVAPSPSPTVAQDSDEIESVWVNQAETIIEQTQNDPHSQEEAVESLSKDYLHKRFGIDVDKT